MATRMHARRATVELLYAYDMGNDSAISQAPSYFDSKNIRNRQQKFGISLLKGVVAHVCSIDLLLKAFIEDWDPDRIGKIEKAVLRLATYEICYTETDNALAINEALELCRSYGIKEAVKFVNSVLDKIANGDADEIMYRLGL